MHPMWFGDSYDIVKRFFIEALTSLGYTVYVDPMLTEKWRSKDDEIKYYQLLNAKPMDYVDSTKMPKALFLDPDTGVKSGHSKHHVAFDVIAKNLDDFDILISFDQSFSRGNDHLEQMQNKLAELKNMGCCGFFYDSHAKFLLASKDAKQLIKLEKNLINAGLPKRRLIRSSGE
ncbi:MAG: hypothetical protein AAB278_06400 [Pseudomonadota bacterium]